jgi:holliday junction DNA helicase RuvA
MIALLTGSIAHRAIDQLVLDVGGVGYRLMIPLSTFYTLPETGSVRLHVYTHVKEDAIHLYGFSSLAEKELFILLLSVSGIGPRLALNILSNIAAGDLGAALAQGDLRRLSTIPGIGRKTAERMVLELKDKIGRLVHAPLPTSKQQTAGPATLLEDALSALINLGYKENQARKVLESMTIAADAPLEVILRGALKILVK